MKPLRFKVRKLYEVTDRDGVTSVNVGDDVNEFFRGELRVTILAYQLTPCGDYSECIDIDGLITETTYDNHINTSIQAKDDEFKVRLYLNVRTPLQPFLVPAEHYSSFCDAVHSYNLKYCDLPDVKVLDGFYEWTYENMPEYCEKRGTNELFLNVHQKHELLDAIQTYKDTLVSFDSWFEMEGE